MPAKSRENPLTKTGNFDAFFREKYLTKNIKKIVGHSGAMTLTEKVYTHLDMQVLVDAINKTLEDEDSVTADTKSA